MQDNTVNIDTSQSPTRLTFAPVLNVAVPFVDRHADEGRGCKTAIRTADGPGTHGELAANGNRPGNAWVG